MAQIDGGQLVAREVNDRTYSLLWGMGAEEGDFACECGRTECSQQLKLTLIEYAAREDGRPLFAPGHGPRVAVNVGAL